MGASEIKVDQLMHEIRHAVAQRRGEKGHPDSRVTSQNMPAALERPTGQIDGSPLVLQPDFQPRSTDRFHLNDLLKYHGRDFVRNAYRALLRREPDGPGLAHHLENLASGRFNKIDILASLSSSPEGKHSAVEITGLAWPATIRRLGRIPVIGYLLQVAIGLARLPTMLTHQRQYEFYALARQEQIVDYTNQRALTIEGEIRGQRQAFESGHKEINFALGTLRNEIAATLTRLGDVDARLATFTAQLDETVADQKTSQTHWRAEHETLTATHQRLVDELGLQQRRFNELVDLAQVQSGLDEEGLDELYAAFENQFRGEPKEIKTRLRVYLPVLERAKVTQDVLDIGCGRGEWLELLRESGRQGRGVDHNRIFIEHCKHQGLDVVKRDAIAYLTELPDESLNAITSFHLVEHLPFKVLIQLLGEMARVLRPGAPLILETPNPENFMVGSHTFYADPTHRNPIPSGTLRFLLESRGLTGIEIIHMRPWDEAKIAGDDELTKRFNEYFYGSPDYGIVGWKT